MWATHAVGATALDRIRRHYAVLLEEGFLNNVAQRTHVIEVLHLTFEPRVVLENGVPTRASLPTAVDILEAVRGLGLDTDVWDSNHQDDRDKIRTITLLFRARSHRVFRAALPEHGQAHQAHRGEGLGGGRYGLAMWWPNHRLHARFLQDRAERGGGA